MYRTKAWGGQEEMRGELTPSLMMPKKRKKWTKRGVDSSIRNLNNSRF